MRQVKAKLNLPKSDKFLKRSANKFGAKKMKSKQKSNSYIETIYFLRRELIRLSQNKDAL